MGRVLLRSNASPKGQKCCDTTAMRAQDGWAGQIVEVGQRQDPEHPCGEETVFREVIIRDTVFAADFEL